MITNLLIGIVTKFSEMSRRVGALAHLTAHYNNSDDDSMSNDDGSERNSNDDASSLDSVNENDDYNDAGQRRR